MSEVKVLLYSLVFLRGLLLVSLSNIKAPIKRKNIINIALQPQEQDQKLKSQVIQCVYIHLLPLTRGGRNKDVNLTYNATICDLFF